MSVQVEKVSKFYGKQKALNEISFTLKPGEICGFLGPNGAGKSTLMKIITGYLSDFSGEVFIQDFNIKNSPLEAKKESDTCRNTIRSIRICTSANTFFMSPVYTRHPSLQTGQRKSWNSRDCNLKGGKK